MTTLQIDNVEYTLEPFGVPPRDVPSWKIYGGRETYIVSIKPASCSCRDWHLVAEGTGRRCKHIQAVAKHIKGTK